MSARFTGVASGLWPTVMSTKVGQLAEDLAERFLQSQGMKVIARNWRSRFAEIDIVARRGKQVHIVEVKYRRNPNFGTGFDYITPDKKRRLKQAALTWTAEHGVESYQIDVVAVSGPLDASTLEYLPNCLVD